MILYLWGDDVPCACRNVPGAYPGRVAILWGASRVLRRLFGGVDQWNNSCFGGQFKASADQLKKVVLGVYPSNGGPRPKMQVWHGNADSTLAPLNYQETIKQWTGVFDGISAQGVGHSVPTNLARQCGVVWIVRTSSIDWLNALGFDAGFTVLGKKPSIKAIQSLKDVMPVSFAVGLVAAARNTTSSQTRKIERAPVPWVVVLFVCSTTLMALGIAGVYQSFRCFRPYEGPHIRQPVHGSAFFGAYVARQCQGAAFAERVGRPIYAWTGWMGSEAFRSEA
ncbi:hypothetical protein SCARD494_12766 [Seiridium cardinale]